MSQDLSKMAFVELNAPTGLKRVDYSVSYAVPRRAVHRGRK